MAGGRRRRSRVFVHVERPPEAPAEEPAEEAEAEADLDEEERARRRAPTFIVTPLPQAHTEPMVIVPPRPPRSDDDA